MQRLQGVQQHGDAVHRRPPAHGWRTTVSAYCNPSARSGHGQRNAEAHACATGTGTRQRRSRAARCAERPSVGAAGATTTATASTCRRGSCTCAPGICGPNCGKVTQCGPGEQGTSNCECICLDGYERSGDNDECLPIPSTSAAGPGLRISTATPGRREMCGPNGRCNVNGESCVRLSTET